MARQGYGSGSVYPEEEERMGIIYKQGDILESEAQAIVIPVNCKGVMGKGLALQAKQKWPSVYDEYRQDCTSGVLRPGHIGVYRTYNQARLVFGFPTKDHWRNPSKLCWIRTGLEALHDEIIIQEVFTIAVPPLGCGLGQLHWADVRPLIEEQLSDIVGLTVEVYEPD